MVAGTPHVRLLPARAERDWALDPADLEAAVAADVAAGLIPFYLVATFGTTSSCAVDPLRLLGELAARHGMWRAPRSPGRCRRGRASCRLAWLATTEGACVVGGKGEAHRLGAAASLRFVKRDARRQAMS